jgi:heme-degrading monooxygenase HmoA
LIVRVLHACVAADQVGPFRERAEQAVLSARSHAGIIHAEVARQAHSDGGERIVFVSVWRDLAALYEWTGGDLLSTPMLADGQAELFTEFDVQHYEVIDVGPPLDAVEGEAPQAVTEPA